MIADRPFQYLLSKQTHRSQEAACVDALIKNVYVSSPKACRLQARAQVRFLLILRLC